MRILKEDTVALVIDVQERLLPAMHNNETLANSLNIFVEGLKALEVPFLVTEQYPKGLGHTTPELSAVLGEFTAIPKVSFSCCQEPAFMEALKASGKKNVLIAGIESHVCVLQTVVDLLAHGFQPVVITDCLSSRTVENKELGIARMRQEGALLSGTESILFELCQKAGSPTFKAISKLIK